MILECIFIIFFHHYVCSDECDLKDVVVAVFVVMNCTVFLK